LPRISSSSIASRRSLADSLTRFAADTGAVLIAEGIEKETELASLGELGVSHGQGFYLARPAAIEDLPGAVSAGVARLRPHVRPGPHLSTERTAGAASLRV